MSGGDVVVEAFTEMAPVYEQVVDSELSAFWGWGYEEFASQLIRLAHISAGERVLDVATGTALIPRKVVDGTAAGEIVGLDITLSMLREAQQYMNHGGRYKDIRLTCASAMEMPFAEGTFDRAICALATHHMDVSLMLSEMSRILRAGGVLVLADAAASRLWQLPGVKTLARAYALIHFVSTDSVARAWAEASAVSNIRTVAMWRTVLSQAGFEDIEVIKLASGHALPALVPVILRASRGSVGK